MRKPFRMQAGMSSMLWATVCFLGMKIFVKLLPRLPIAEIVLFRALFTFVFSYVLLRLQSQSPWGPPGTRLWLLLRGLGGVTALFLYFYLIQRIPLASAYAIQYLAPIFTALIAFLWLKERVRPVQWGLFLLAFLGVLMVQGFDIRISFLHLLVGLGATFCMGFTYVLIRRLKGWVHPLTIVFYFSVVALPLVGLYVPFHWVQPQGWEWVWLLGMACFTQAAQYYSAQAAFQAAQLSTIAAVSYIGIVFALMAGFFFGEYYEPLTYLGMGLVLLSVALSIHLKDFHKNDKHQGQK